MPIDKNKGIKVEMRHNMVDININISIKRRTAWIILLVSACLLILIASSVNEDVRSFLIDALLWVLQVLLFGKTTSDHNS